MRSVFEYKDIEKVPLLDAKSIVPRGATALLDAIGRSIMSANERRRLLSEVEKISKVYFVIITDGQENCSREYDCPTILKKIRAVEKDKGWEFIYIGANQDAMAEAEKKWGGVRPAQVMDLMQTQKLQKLCFPI